MAATLSELEIAFYKRETGSASNNYDDLRHAYAVAKMPATVGSITDKMRAYYLTKLGGTGVGKTFTDLENDYYASIVGAGTNLRYRYFRDAPLGS